MLRHLRAPLYADRLAHYDRQGCASGKFRRQADCGRKTKSRGLGKPALDGRLGRVPNLRRHRVVHRGSSRPTDHTGPEQWSVIRGNRLSASHGNFCAVRLYDVHKRCNHGIGTSGSSGRGIIVYADKKRVIDIWPLPSPDLYQQHHCGVRLFSPITRVAI